MLHPLANWLPDQANRYSIWVSSDHYGILLCRLFRKAADCLEHLRVSRFKSVLFSCCYCCWAKVATSSKQSAPKSRCRPTAQRAPFVSAAGRHQLSLLWKSENRNSAVWPAKPGRMSQRWLSGCLCLLTLNGVTEFESACHSQFPSAAGQLWAASARNAELTLQDPKAKARMVPGEFCALI